MGMGPIIWTCLALTVHQSPGQEYFMPSRGIRLPLKTDPKRVGEVQAFILLVSKDKGKTWEQMDRKPPSEHEFIYRAPEDGPYWFIVQQEDRNGRVTPANPERVKPSMAVIVDTAPPRVKVTAERLPSGAIRAHWMASDLYPDLRSLRVDYHTNAVPEGQWTPLPAAMVLEGDKEFELPKEGRTGEVRVRVQMKDQAGNVGEDVYVLHAAATPSAGQVETGPFSVIPTTPSNPAGQPNQLTSQQRQRPIIEAAPGSIVPPAAAAPPPTPVAPPVPAAELSGPGPSPGPAPLTGLPIASNDERIPPPTSNPTVASGQFAPVRIVKSREVRIDFTVGKVGPSGLGNADVYVTLDRGANWKKMPGEVPISLPPGADIHGAEVTGSLGVQLPAEGTIYGFIVAVKSKAGRAPPPPRQGDAPQALVELDTTAPKGQLYRPQPDPTQPNTLLLAWKAEDRNLGEKPITLEWAEQKDGPWNIIGEPQLPNTGQYPWRLPERLPPRVYLRLTMRDLAGNESRAQTDKPELIDLSVPQTKIIGIAPAAR